MTATTNFSPVPSFDADGNMTEGPVTGAAGLSPGVPAPTGATDLLWDAENRLVGATVGASTLSYTYDHLSRLVKRAVTVGGTTTTSHYLYNGWNRIAEWNETSLSKVYLWGLDVSGTAQGAGGVGGLLSILDVGTTFRYYPTYDGNGNVSEYINSNLSGAAMLAAHFEYDPFGNLTAGTAANAEAFPYRFSTKPQDPVTGMLYYGYRWYDPLTGRWPSRDPIEEEGGVNIYEFVGNSSVGRRDRLGLYCVQTSFRWITYPKIVRATLHWETAGEVTYLDEIVAEWEGEAEVGCCCGPSFWRSVYTAKGTMVAESRARGNTDIFITSLFPFPIIPVPRGIGIAELTGELIAKIIEHESGKIPVGATLDEVESAARDIAAIIDQMGYEDPPPMKWKGGWPCK